MLNNKKTIAISIPTGIGLEHGGYAGDFGYIAVEFSKYFNLIINPNAVNGGIFSAINENMQYVEGYAFDEFLCGKINLTPVDTQNKIGVIFDCAIPENILNLHINTLNALKIVAGIDVFKYAITKEPVGVDFSINRDTKISQGNVNNPRALLNSARELIANGANALGVVCYFKDYDENDDFNYTNALGVDPIGGVEAIVSHYLVKEFKIPTAHAPAFSSLDISSRLENPKVAAECVSSTYLPCIIKGLQYAPQFAKAGKENASHINKKGISAKDINVKDIIGLVVPSTALGSKGVFGAISNGVKLFKVKNKSQLNIGCAELKIEDNFEYENYFELLEHLRSEYA